MTIQQPRHGNHVLAFTDISSAFGWMHKASFDPVNKGGHDTVAQWLGWTIFSNMASLYYQKIKGTENIICGITLKVFQYFKSVPHKKFQLYYTTLDSGIIPHQNDTQRDYLLDIFTSSIPKMTERIDKATATKKSVNWEIWCTFLTHTGITNKFLDGIQKGENTILVSSFKASVWRNQFSAARKTKLLHGTIKATVLDISPSLRKHLQGKPTLDASGQISLRLPRQLRNYKYVDPYPWITRRPYQPI